MDRSAGAAVLPRLLILAAALLLAGCATTQSAQMKGLIAASEDPKYTEAAIAQLKAAGADDKVVQERFALDGRLKAGTIGQREYETEMGKLQVRMDANRAKQEADRRRQRDLLSIVQSVAGVALSAVI
jgi:hypothetical protein